MKYDLTVKNNELLIKAMIWMILTIMLSEKSRSQRVRTEWLHLCEVVENANKCIVTELVI